MAGPLRPIKLAKAAIQWMQETCPVGILATDLDLVVVSWNQWLVDRSGRAEYVVGRPLPDLFPDLEERGFLAHFQAAAEGQVKYLAQRFHRYLLQLPSSISGRSMEQSASISPLTDKGELIGTITVIDDVTHRVLQEETLRTHITELEAVRARLGLALAHEQDLVQTFARSFLQDCATDTPLDVACLYQPAVTLDHVGGDFYDFVSLGPKLAVVIGDVCGKGIKAGVYTAMVKYTLRAYADEHSTPASLIQQVNEALCRQINDPGMFISLVFALIDLDKETIQWTNAGHPSPVLTTTTGELHYLTSGGPVLGTFPEARFKGFELPYRPGTTLAMFTDGVTESRGVLSGTEESGIGELLLQGQHQNAQEIVQALFQFASAQGPLRDDVAIVAARYPAA